MKKYLLPQNGNFYKANLHCHSNISDGKLSPEEIKKEYTEKGYSIVAFTDHDILIPHRDLADENFLPLLGFEVEINENKPNAPFSAIKTCHICFIALDPDNDIQPCWNPDELFGNAPNFIDKVKFDPNQPHYIREYTPEKVSKMMGIVRDSGFFVTYNHPTWSQENYNDYINYHNMHAMEIMNYGCISLGYDDYNSRVYNDMLKAGKRIYCIGADDNHNKGQRNTGKWDSGGAFTVIKAEKLEYKTITDALLNGEFYASEGPEIYDLYVEDNKLVVNCSNVKKIAFEYGDRFAESYYGEGDETINSAAGSLSPERNYVRVTVTDKHGKKAFTNAYFMDEIL